MKSNKKSFVLYCDYLEHIEKLSNEDAGKLFKAILDYEANGSVAELGGAAGMAFSFIQAQLNRDKANYEEVCRTRQENGKKGGRPKKEIEAEEPRKPNGYSKNQMVNYKPDNGSDTDNDTENDIEQKIYTAQCAEDVLHRVCYLLNVGNAKQSHKGRIKPDSQITRIYFDELKKKGVSEAEILEKANEFANNGFRGSMSDFCDLWDRYGNYKNIRFR